MEIESEGTEPLRFSDGSPVRAASGVVPFGDGFLVLQDDATHGAWFRGGSASAVRLLPSVQGLDVFEAASGTKHLKPDLEAACLVDVDGERAVLSMGSGSSPARTRWSLLRMVEGDPTASTAEMAPLYAAVAEALAVPADVLNLEGACVIGEALRWFHRGLPAAGHPSASVDLDLSAALSAASGRTDPGAVALTNPRHYDLGQENGVGMAVTDAVALPDGSILVSAAAEDSPSPRDDGPVVASALAWLVGDDVVDVVALPRVEGEPAKVEGLMVMEARDAEARVLAVVDVDDPGTPSLAMFLRVRYQRRNHPR